MAATLRVYARNEVSGRVLLNVSRAQPVVMHRLFLDALRTHGPNADVLILLQQEAVPPIVLAQRLPAADHVTYTDAWRTRFGSPGPVSEPPAADPPVGPRR
jgi:hypothetical protein